jgi:hypothetical protein
LSAVAERYRSAGRREKGRILDELCATTGWHRKHAVAMLAVVKLRLNKHWNLFPSGRIFGR